MSTPPWKARCMGTPTESPLPKKLSMQRRWICEHRWEGVAGLIAPRQCWDSACCLQEPMNAKATMHLKCYPLYIQIYARADMTLSSTSCFRNVTKLSAINCRGAHEWRILKPTKEFRKACGGLPITRTWKARSWQLRWSCLPKVLVQHVPKKTGGSMFFLCKAACTSRFKFFFRIISYHCTWNHIYILPPWWETSCRNSWVCTDEAPEVSQGRLAFRIGEERSPEFPKMWVDQPSQ